MSSGICCLLGETVPDTLGMRWRVGEQMAEKFEALRTDPDSASRGIGLESLLAELFGREHFRVEKDFVADGRQVDLFVIRGDLRLLVEAKWTKRRSQQDVIDAMRARLETAAPGVVGLVVSMSGFSSKVVARVERSAERPILLMDGEEVEQVLAHGGGVYSLVQSKMDQLLRNRRAAVGLESRPSAVWLRDLPEAGLKIVDLDGREHPWWESRGDFSQVVNSLASPDQSWAREGGTRLNLRLGIRDAVELVGLLKRLTQLGWITTEGAWRIEQQGVVWAGLGPAEFGRQLTDWEPRYLGRRLHHSEVAMYVDESEDGMLTLTADLSARPERMLRWCELSFMLPGIPLDPTPYAGLMAELPVMNTPSFEILNEDPVCRNRFLPRGKPRRARPLAYLVRDGSLRPSDGPSVRWVEGIVAADPTAHGLAPRIRAARPALKLGHVFVSLRQHHHLGDEVSHDLLWSTLVQASSANVFHVMGDWGYVEQESG